MAARLQGRKIDILETRAKTVVTTNHGCLLQIRSDLAKAGANVEALHIADFLNRAAE